MRDTQWPCHQRSLVFDIYTFHDRLTSVRGSSIHTYILYILYIDLGVDIDDSYDNRLGKVKNRKRYTYQHASVTK